MNQSPSIHASAVLVGARAVLIQGPAGSGKSRLALALLQAAAQGLLPFARLVADDRAHVEAAHGRLLVRPAAALAGLIEVRGLGIRRVPYEPLAVVGVLVELGAQDAERLPARSRAQAVIAGITLPRLAVAAGADRPPRGAGPSADHGPPGLIVAVRQAWKIRRKPHISGLRRAVETTGLGRLLQCSNPLQSGPEPLNSGFGS